MTLAELKRAIEIRNEILVQTERLENIQELKEYAKIRLCATDYSEGFYLSEEEIKEITASLILKTQNRLDQLKKEFEDL